MLWSWRCPAGNCCFELSNLYLEFDKLGLQALNMLPMFSESLVCGFQDFLDTSELFGMFGNCLSMAALVLFALPQSVSHLWVIAHTLFIAVPMIT